jgi:hypothetical protein
MEKYTRKSVFIRVIRGKAFATENAEKMQNESAVDLSPSSCSHWAQPKCPAQAPRRIHPKIYDGFSVAEFIPP